jgi:thiol-disulfide isomerase/thioredoxin
MVLRAIALVALLASAFHGFAQLSGTLAFSPRPASIVLLDTRGGDHRSIDTAQVDRRGRFRFTTRHLRAGFFQLAVNDTDRVDIILDPREKEVRLTFSGLPLQENIIIHASLENQRLWEYKRISRNTQQNLAMLRQQRAGVAPQDVEAHQRMDSSEAAMVRERAAAMERLITTDTTSYFHHVVRADRRLSAAISAGGTRVGSTFNWNDDRLLHSSVYAKAVLGWMQTAPPDLPDGLISATDSLFLWTRSSPGAWTYVRSLLARLFDQHGPDFMLQYIVDRYAFGADALLPLEQELVVLLEEQLRVSTGAQGENVLLPDPATGDTTSLYELLDKAEHTLLFFYSSTCEHCLEQMPLLDQIHHEWRPRGVQVVGIAIDDDREEFLALRAAGTGGWPAFSELRAWGSPAAKAYNVKATPAYVLLGRTGTILAKPYDLVEVQVELEHLQK